MNAHLLLDEMFSAAAAQQLRERSVDAKAIDEDGLLRGISDEEVLALAKREGRVVVTFNVRDFIELDRRIQSSGESHNGIILISAKSFSHAKSSWTALLDALERAASSGAALHGHVSWLR